MKKTKSLFDQAQKIELTTMGLSGNTAGSPPAINGVANSGRIVARIFELVKESPEKP
ncbi:MAG: hypothetical protein IKW00_04810 [Clostridia bacterium]|nr:hypothetical protein [Clostridia bacterium]